MSSPVRAAVLLGIAFACAMSWPGIAAAQDPGNPTGRTSGAAQKKSQDAEASPSSPKQEDPPPDEAPSSFEKWVDDKAEWLKVKIETVLLYDVSRPFMDLEEGEKGIGVPAVAAYLVAASIFFTLWTRFLNIRAFKHAILVTAGKYDDPTDPGEVSHFQALSAALSATVGLGNIAGVAVAVATGGPGATFWMILMGFFSMSLKFTECTLGQKYREVRPDGRIMGGAMYYLSKGLKEIGLGPLGAVLAPMFALLCIFASFGGGNAFQVNQSMNAVNEQITFLKGDDWIYGLGMAFLVGLVILGGIRRIAHVAEAIVPLMCCVYVAACVFILLKNANMVPDAMAMIVREAFHPKAVYGGFLAVLFLGVQRAAFSNEAGIGSAAIAHSAARTDFPVREGIVALLEPFIDTVIVCTMTALVIVITGVYASDDPAIRTFIEEDQGAALTASAMGQEISWFPYVLSVAVCLFAYSTMISWSYYGERCWAYLFGDRSSIIYRIMFLICTFLGSIVSATNVLVLSTLMLLSMAVPNIIGLVLLSPKVRRDLNDYWRMYKTGEFTDPSAPAATEKTS